MFGLWDLLASLWMKECWKLKDISYLRQAFLYVTIHNTYWQFFCYFSNKTFLFLHFALLNITFSRKRRSSLTSTYSEGTVQVRWECKLCISCQACFPLSHCPLYVILLYIIEGTRWECEIDEFYLNYIYLCIS